MIVALLVLRWATPAKIDIDKDLDIIAFWHVIDVIVSLRATVAPKTGAQ